jgi:hypothetical protein
MRLETFRWLYNNRQLLPLIVLTEEATFTVTESKTHLTRIDDLMTIHMVLWKQIFNLISLQMCDTV